MLEVKGVKTCPNEKCQLHIDKKTFGADIECCPECGAKLVYGAVEEKPKFKLSEFVGQAVFERIGSALAALISPEKKDVFKKAVDHGGKLIKELMNKVSSALHRK